LDLSEAVDDGGAGDDCQGHAGFQRDSPGQIQAAEKPFLTDGFADDGGASGTKAGTQCQCEPGLRGHHSAELTLGGSDQLEHGEVAGVLFHEHQEGLSGDGGTHHQSDGCGDQEQQGYALAALRYKFPLSNFGASRAGRSSPPLRGGFASAFQRDPG